MAYITAEDVKAVRNALKAEFGNKFKFGVTKQHHSSVNIVVKSGPAPLDTYEMKNQRGDMMASNGNFQVNHYHTHMYGEFQGFFDRLSEIAHTAPGLAGGRKWFDDSDAMTDYFSTAYYVNIEVGKYDKPYINTSK